MSLQNQNKIISTEYLEVADSEILQVKKRLSNGEISIQLYEKFIPQNNTPHRGIVISNNGVVNNYSYLVNLQIKQNDIYVEIIDGFVDPVMLPSIYKFISTTYGRKPIFIGLNDYDTIFSPPNIDENSSTYLTNLMGHKTFEGKFVNHKYIFTDEITNGLNDNNVRINNLEILKQNLIVSLGSYFSRQDKPFIRYNITEVLGDNKTIIQNNDYQWTLSQFETYNSSEDCDMIIMKTFNEKPSNFVCDQTLIINYNKMITDLEQKITTGKYTNLQHFAYIRAIKNIGFIVMELSEPIKQMLMIKLLQINDYDMKIYGNFNNTTCPVNISTRDYIDQQENLIRTINTSAYKIGSNSTKFYYPFVVRFYKYSDFQNIELFKIEKEVIQAINKKIQTHVMKLTPRPTENDS